MKVWHWVVLGVVVLATEVQASELRWHSCQPASAGFQCASLTVPVDYLHPVKKIHLAVTRRLANLPHKKIGTLIVNFGGPWSDDSKKLIKWAPAVNKSILDRFDLVAFAPRGTGLTKITCNTPLNVKLALAQTSTVASFKQYLKLKHQQNQLCQHKVGGLVQHISTNNTIKDLEKLRLALGIKKLNFIGYSYGSKLGALYLQKYPTHVRAMMLDGNMPPGIRADTLIWGDAKAYEKTLYQFFKTCQRSKNCPLHDDPEKDYLLALKLAKTTHIRGNKAIPRLTPGMIRLDTSVVLNFTGPNGTSNAFPQNMFPLLASGIAQVITQHRGDKLADLFVMVAAYDPVQHKADFDVVFPAVMCVDDTHFPSVTYSVQMMQKIQKRYPLIGASIAANLSSLCVGWSIKPTPLPLVNLAKNKIPVLLVANKTDPETPFAWSKTLANSIANSKLLVWNGIGHTAYLNNTTANSCVGQAVASYFINPAATLPKQCSDFANPWVRRDLLLSDL